MISSFLKKLKNSAAPLSRCGIFAALDTSKEISWHTPGHKGLLSRLDSTEIDDSFPRDLISKAQCKLSKAYGVGAVRFLTNGSSMGIKAGLMSLPGDVLIESNCHQAVREGLILARKTMVEIPNIIKNDLPQPLSANQVRQALEENPSIKTVVITSPDYYGQTVDANEILSLIKEYGVHLYVDAAHGAHFGFRRDLFSNDLTRFADIANISAHKTLPAFTQSAYLCINNLRILPKVDQNLQLLGTTSPSYILLAGLEFAAEYCIENAQMYDNLFIECQKIQNQFRCLKNNDFTRIVIDSAHYQMSGSKLYYRLKHLGHIAEKFDDRYVVLILTIVDTQESISALKDALKIAITQAENNF